MSMTVIAVRVGVLIMKKQKIRKIDIRSLTHVILIMSNERGNTQNRLQACRLKGNQNNQQEQKGSHNKKDYVVAFEALANFVWWQ